MVYKAVAVCLALYGALVASMYFMQRHLQYLPSHRDLKPSDVGLPNLSRLVLPTSDGEAIVVWYAKAPEGRPTVLFFHGNAAEVAERAERVAFFQSNQFGFLAVEYRGFGASTGTPSEAGLVTDANTAYEFLKSSGARPSDIFVIGESLGTGVGIQLAAKNPVGALALEAPYSSAVEVGASTYWFLPVRFLMKDQFRSIDFVSSLHSPLLITHGEDDRVIPIAMGQKLFATANEPKNFRSIPHVGHDVIFKTDTWIGEVEFFNKILSEQRD
jgi:fermentation-respiration switch protein FrsA (DUF1100 family)